MTLRERIAAIAAEKRDGHVMTYADADWLLRLAAAYATEVERHRESAPSAMTQPYCVFDMEPYPCPTVCAREAVERG